MIAGFPKIIGIKPAESWEIGPEYPHLPARLTTLDLLNIGKYPDLVDQFPIRYGKRVLH